MVAYCSRFLLHLPTVLPSPQIPVREGLERLQRRSELIAPQRLARNLVRFTVIDTVNTTTTASLSVSVIDGNSRHRTRAISLLVMPVLGHPVGHGSIILALVHAFEGDGNLGRSILGEGGGEGGATLS